MNATSSSMSSTMAPPYDAFPEERRERLGLISDEQIASLSHAELIDRFKSAQITIITEASRNDMVETDLERNKRTHAAAIAQATTRQAAANLAENRQNRADFDVMERNTTLCTVGRVISLVVSVAMLILTIVCIVL